MDMAEAWFQLAITLTHHLPLGQPMAQTFMRSFINEPVWCPWPSHCLLHSLKHCAEARSATQHS